MERRPLRRSLSQSEWGGCGILLGRCASRAATTEINAARRRLTARKPVRRRLTKIHKSQEYGLESLFDIQCCEFYSELSHLKRLQYKTERVVKEAQQEVYFSILLNSSADSVLSHVKQPRCT